MCCLRVIIWRLPGMANVEAAGSISIKSPINHLKTNFMFTHLFKLIWNKKRQNALLIIEMFVSFIVMFAVFTAIVYAYKNYKLPMGFSYENVWSVRFAGPENIKQQ